MPYSLVLFCLKAAEERISLKFNSRCYEAKHLNLAAHSIFFADEFLGNAAQMLPRMKFISNVCKVQHVGFDPIVFEKCLEAHILATFLSFAFYIKTEE